MPRTKTEVSDLRDWIYAEIRPSLPDGVSAKRFQGWGPNGRESYIEFAHGRVAAFGSGDLCLALDDHTLWLIRQGRSRPNWKTTYSMGIGGRLAFGRGYSVPVVARKLIRALNRLTQGATAQF